MTSAPDDETQDLLRTSANRGLSRSMSLVMPCTAHRPLVDLALRIDVEVQVLARDPRFTTSMQPISIILWPSSTVRPVVSVSRTTCRIVARHSPGASSMRGFGGSRLRYGPTPSSGAPTLPAVSGVVALSHVARETSV